MVDPVGLRLTLRKVCERYGLPILISENGMGAPDKLEPDGTVNDDYRIAFLDAHIAQMRLAIADGVELMGYCPWAAIDVVSTHQGYAKRYGFIYVDRGEDDLKRLQRIANAASGGIRMSSRKTATTTSRRDDCSEGAQ